MQPDDEWEWPDEDCPLPDGPPDDLPDDPEPEDVDNLDEIVRLHRGRNRLDGSRALWIVKLLAETSPVGPISARDQVAAEIGPALGLGSRPGTRLVDGGVALPSRVAGP